MATSAHSGSATRLLASPRVDSHKPASWFAAMQNTPTPHLPSLPFPSIVVDFFLNPYTPLVFGVVYFVLTSYLSSRTDGKNRIQGKGWDVAVAIHNILLCVYSVWTFAKTGPAFISAFWRSWWEGGFAGLAHVFCDSDTAIWSATSFPSVCWLFYISKYYEIVDTAIILLKGKRVDLLQSYHHTGAIWTMYAGFRSAAPPVWLFVIFNSAVHSIMYCYYALSAMKLPFPRFLKKQITRMQITQFLVGGSLAASYLFIQLPALSNPAINFNQGISFGTLSLSSLERVGTQCLVNSGQKAAVLLNVVYLVPLTFLFAAFFVRSYRNKPATRAASAGKKVN